MAVGCWLLAFAVCVLEQCIDKAAAGGMAIALSAVICAEPSSSFFKMIVHDPIDRNFGRIVKGVFIF